MEAKGSEKNRINIDFKKWGIKMHGEIKKSRIYVTVNIKHQNNSHNETRGVTTQYKLRTIYGHILI